MISDKIIRFHPVAPIDPDFAALALNAGYSSAVIKTLKSGMAESQVNISQPKLKMVPIPVPPLAEQKRILAKVNELIVMCNELEAKLTKSSVMAENLAEAVVGRFGETGD